MNPNNQELVNYGKDTLNQCYQAVEAAFKAEKSGLELVQIMCTGVDDMLVHIWQNVAPESSKHIAFVAVGGYGRGELAPQSDWDIWFILPENATEQMNDDIQSFMYVMWDMSAKIGHAVRSVKETISHIKEDWNSATTAQEMRLLCGKASLFNHFSQETSIFFKKQRKKFVEAKLQEHQWRHERTGDSAFMMEPDIKECKGGLRDVQSVFWIAKAWFEADNLDALVTEGHISQREIHDLLMAQDFLWRCRVGLHLQTKRPNDRLSFEQQAALAESMGYQPVEHLPAVDGLMKDYFGQAGRIARVSSLILQDINEHMNESFFIITRNIDNDFTLTGNKVGIRHKNVFKDNPLNLLRIFNIGQEDHRQLSNAALRQIREDERYLMNDAFRANPEAHRLFMRILKHPRNVSWALKAMKDTGVLGGFVPAFYKVVGLGQFNQYHAYTVDEHTLHAIGEARNMIHGDRKLRLPLAQEVFHRLKRPELLYLALLFHDIAKGMAGDHSENGEVLAQEFCTSIGLIEDASNLVAWLVRMHLTMAVTSQRFDLSDPEVIQTFADKVGSLERLNCLLCLTVADIAAVGPNVWNDWKGSLLNQLYHATRHALMGEKINPEVLEKQQQSRIRSTLQLSEKADLIEPVLKQLPNRFIAHFPPYQLVPIAELLADSGFMNNQADFAVGHFIDHERCDTMMMIAAKERPGLFVKLASVIAAGQINVVAAHAFSLGNDNILDVFHIQNREKQPLVEPQDLERLQARIINMLQDEKPLEEPKQPHIRSNVLMERVPVRVRTLPLASFNQTAIEVTAADRTGLLASLSYEITHAGFSINGAAISSFGERIVDVFFIHDDGNQLSSEKIKALSKTLKEVATLEEV
ncbi:MAG: [protein-PII] uridylyltransferase [Ghiorsea sp.]|nr:[protein-PII] uridylyltransferase [Ghiorsea sp.]